MHPRSQLRFLLAGITAAMLACAQPSEGRVAYLAHDGGYWQVWVMDANGARATQITDSNYEKTRVSWFPDGRDVLVNSLDGRLFRVDTDSGSEVEIPIPLTGTTDAVVSPRGDRIAFSVSTADAIDDNEIWTILPDGSSLEKFTTMNWLQHEPQWGSEANWIYFLSGKGDDAHDIWRVSTATKGTEQLTAGALYHFDLAVGSDGSLAFSSNRSGNYEIWIQRESEDARPVSPHPALDGRPSWNRAANALIFHSSRSGALQLWRWDEPESEARQLTRHDGGARAPAWWHGSS